MFNVFYLFYHKIPTQSSQFYSRRVAEYAEVSQSNYLLQRVIWSLQNLATLGHLSELLLPRNIPHVNSVHSATLREKNKFSFCVSLIYS